MRRAAAIQLIIARELGLSHNDNPLQGSFVIEELTREGFAIRYDAPRHDLGTALSEYLLPTLRKRYARA